MSSFAIIQYLSNKRINYLNSLHEIIREKAILYTDEIIP